MPTLGYYTRRGCHLCEQMLEELLPLIRGRAELEIRDVDTRQDWLRLYDSRVPVVEYKGRVITEYPMDRDAIFELLAEFGANGQ